MPSGECCSCCPFVKLFLTQFFDFGYNCGSLISEALGLFRTFQRVSATKSFSAKFSPECLEMFSWAKNLINILTTYFQTVPLTDFEYFNVYTLIIPMVILTLLSSALSEGFYYYCIAYGLFITLGCGLGFLGINSVAAGLMITFSLILIIFGLIFKNCPCCECCLCFQVFRKKEDDEEIYNISDMSIPKFIICTPPVFCAFYLMMIPIMIERVNLTNILSIIVGSLIGFCILMIFIDICIIERFVSVSLGDNLINFLSNCLSLLIIPSTEKFIELMKGPYNKDWRIIISYIAISLLLPVAITLINILSKHQSIVEKYKDDHSFFYFIELIDIIKQLIYAILAGYDIVWGCLAIEIAWIIFIFIIRPYKDYSEYILTVGNCLVTTISNIAILCAIYKKIQRFNFAASISLVVIACLPAIISMYVFFILDFGVDDDDDDYEYKPLIYVGYFTRIITPIAWFFYGLNIPIINGKLKYPYE